MSFLRVPLFTLTAHYLLLHLGFCEAYQNCVVASIKVTTVEVEKFMYYFGLSKHISNVLMLHSKLPNYMYVESVKFLYFMR